LKNVELFEKLSLRFNGRILFLKDVIGSQEICCWSFFAHGTKLAEVCCTSIVYGTDKKNTKVYKQFISNSLSLTGNLFFQVEYPEAKIFEETLNILLYENRDRPDADLMQATKSFPRNSDYNSDEEEERQQHVEPARMQRRK
jgi:BTB/POZ domain-containing adapter for CUL3-mediated RhoA degradation protein